MLAFFMTLRVGSAMNSLEFDQVVRLSLNRGEHRLCLVQLCILGTVPLALAPRGGCFTGRWATQ